MCGFSVLMECFLSLFFVMAENTLRKEMLLQFLKLLIDSNVLNICVLLFIRYMHVGVFDLASLMEDKLCLVVCFLWVFRDSN